VRRPFFLVLVLALAGTIGYLGHRMLWPTEEDRLRAALDALAGIASTPDVEGELPRLVRVQRVRDYLVEEILVRVEDGPVFGGREAIVGALAQASGLGPLRVGFSDVTVRMEPGERTAAVTATVEVERTDPRSGEQSLDAREVEMTWLRPESSWVLSAATVVKPLR
jgi:hypothetical protein